MIYFDLHCDTLTTAYAEGKSLNDSKFDVNFEKGEIFQQYEQCFALWQNDEIHGEKAVTRAKEILSFYENQMKFCPKNITPHFTIENGVSLGGNLENLKFFKAHGLKMMTLTWNGENELGFGAKTKSEKGLKDFGKRVVEKMQEEKIIIDVSHLNEKGFEEVFQRTNGKIAASHSNCFEVHHHERNLKDWQIKKIIERKGIIGLCYYDEFLGSDENTMQNFYSHLMHILSLGGNNVVSCGSDFDGCKMGREIKDLSSVVDLNAFLEKKGVEKEQREKLFFKNANFFINNILQK